MSSPTVIQRTLSNTGTSSLRPHEPAALERSEPGYQDVSAEASVTIRATPSQTGRFAWFGKLGGGIMLDIRARAPWYISDWTDAWNYRVVPATALIFFAKYA
jgi:hypothetical protein